MKSRRAASRVVPLLGIAYCVALVALCIGASGQPTLGERAAALAGILGVFLGCPAVV